MKVLMNKNVILKVILLLAVFAVSGCVVRTYSVYKERSDIGLNSGNRGYLQGKSTEPAAVAKPTREEKVVEIEVFPLIKSQQKDKTRAAAKNGAGQEANAPGQIPGENVEPQVSQAAPAAAGQQYTVQPNDTLQKISRKFYGTMHKWARIYEANKDSLKAPDKIKPGQVLKIPADISPQPAPETKVEKPKEPVENLK